MPKFLFIKQGMLIRQTIKSLLAKLGLKCKTKNSKLTSRHYKDNLTQENLTRTEMTKKLTMKKMGLLKRTPLSLTLLRLLRESKAEVTNVCVKSNASSTNTTGMLLSLKKLST